MEKCMILSAVCLLSCLHLSIDAQSSNTNAWTPELLPDDPKVIVGHPLIMTCGLKCNCSTCPPRRCVENLVFHINRQFLQKAPVIVSRAHPSFAMLNTTHAQLNMSDVHTEFDHAVVSCYPRGYEKSVNDAQILRVGHLPSTPKIYYHRVVNWDNFVFKWNIPHIHNMVYQALYTAWFKPLGDSDFISCLQCNGMKQDCPHQVTRNHSGSCTVKHVLDLVHPSGFMEFKVNATNLLGRVVSEPEVMSLDLYHHIEPATVKNLEILLSGINAPRVSFTSPKFSYHLTYNLSIICGSAYAESWTIDTKASKYAQSLTDLPCYTNCSVSVSCKPLYADSTYGYWSDSVVKNFVSQEGAPLFAPETCSSCFQSVLSGNNSLRSVFLYYKHLDSYKARGSVTNYRSFKLSSLASSCRVNWTEDCAADFVTVNANASSIHWMLPPEQSFQLAIEASTVAGYNASLLFNSTDHVVDIPLHSTSHNWQVEWSVLNLTAFLRDDRNVKLSWLKHKDAVRYVVVWCIGSRNDMQCTGEVDWLTVTQHQTSYNIHTSQLPTSYLFGVAIETSQSSSGVYWSDCLYDSRKAANPPYVKEKTTDTTITLNIDGRSWRSCEQRKGYVFAYQIVYWVTSKSQGDAQMILVDLSANDRDANAINYDLENLEPETSYTVAVFSVTRTGLSQTNFTVYPVTKEPGMRAGGITAITIGSMVGLLLIIFGIVTCFRKIRHMITNWCNVKVLLPSHENFQNEAIAKSHETIATLSRHLSADDRDHDGGPDGSPSAEVGTDMLETKDVANGDGPHEWTSMLAREGRQQSAATNNNSIIQQSAGAAFDTSQQPTSSNQDEDEQTMSSYRPATASTRPYLPVDENSAALPVHYSCVAECEPADRHNHYHRSIVGEDTTNSGDAIGSGPARPGSSSDISDQMEGIDPDAEIEASGTIELPVSYSSLTVGSSDVNSGSSVQYLAAAETDRHRAVIDGGYSVAGEVGADGNGDTSSAGSGYSRSGDSSAGSYFRGTDNDTSASGYSVDASESGAAIAGGYSRATGNLDTNDYSRVADNVASGSDASGSCSRDACNSGTNAASGGYSQAAYNSGACAACEGSYTRGCDGYSSSDENSNTNGYSVARVDNGISNGDSSDSIAQPASPNFNGRNSGYSTAVVAGHLGDLSATGHSVSQAAENDFQSDDGLGVSGSGGYLGAAIVEENLGLNIDYATPPGQLESMIDADDELEILLAPVSRHSSVDSYEGGHPADYCSASHFLD